MTTPHDDTGPTTTRRVRRDPDHVETEVDGEVVLMHVSSGDFFALDGTARAVWHAAEDGRTVAEVVDRVSRSYTGSRVDIAADTRAFLDELEANGLVTLE